LDVRQLEFFLAVVDERSFTKAAETVFVTQSGLSASIRALERELGVRLFDRGPQGATPTKTGEVFFPRARRMLADARAAQRELLEVSLRETMLVRVGSEQCVGDLIDLVDLMAAFRIDQPQAELSFEQASTGPLMSGLSEGALDIALIAGPVAGDPWQNHPGFTSVVLRREPFVLLAHPKHPLAAARSLAWREVVGQKFVDFQPTWVVRRILDAATETRGLVRQSAVTVNDVHMLIDMVQRDFGVAALPVSLAHKQSASELAKVELVDDDLGWEIRVAVSERAGSTARAFEAMLMPSVLVSEVRTELSAVPRAS
jgi:DNA-binding transcriptional LysR family regulator